MTIQSHFVVNKDKGIHQQPDNANSRKPLNSTVLDCSSIEELTMTALLNPFLTVEEATLEARIYQSHLQETGQHRVSKN